MSVLVPVLALALRRVVANVSIVNCKAEIVAVWVAVLDAVLVAALVVVLAAVLVHRLAGQAAARPVELDATC